MNYQPNTNDPRVLKRIKHAYGYARGVFHETEATPRSQAAIDKRFGKHSHELSKWLRHTLLICVDHHYSQAAGISKKYVLNKEGAEHIRSVLQGNAPKAFDAAEYARIKPYIGNAPMFDEQVVMACAERDFGDELNSLEFVYEDKSNRLWNGIQCIRKQYKEKLLAHKGLKHHYDIQACAPTLLLQHSQHMGNDEYLFEINNYLKHKAAYRQHLSEEVEIEVSKSKLIVNALFCGAKLGLNAQFMLTGVLDNDPARVIYARQLTEQLRADVKTMWSYITPSMPRRRGCTGKLIAVQPKQKWARYFDLERQVLDAVRMYLQQTGNRHFLEHDGWATEYEVDQAALLAFVKKTTGFTINLDYACKSDSESAYAVRSPEVESHLAFASSLQLTDSTSSSSIQEIFGELVNIDIPLCPCLPM
jgi:hypothetical protein